MTSFKFLGEKPNIFMLAMLLSLMQLALLIGIWPVNLVVAVALLSLLHRVSRCQEQARLPRPGDGSALSDNLHLSWMEAEATEQNLAALREADDPLVHQFLTQIQEDNWLLKSEGLDDFIRLATEDRWLAVVPSNAVNISRRLNDHELFARLLHAAPDAETCAVRRRSYREVLSPRQAHVLARDALTRLVADPACMVSIREWRQQQRAERTAAEVAATKPDVHSRTFAAWAAFMFGAAVFVLQFKKPLALALGQGSGSLEDRLTNNAPVFLGMLRTAYAASGPSVIGLFMGFVLAALAAWGMFRLYGYIQDRLPGAPPEPFNTKLMFAMVATLPAFSMAVPVQSEAGSRAVACGIIQGNFTTAAAEGEVARQTVSDIYRQACLGVSGRIGPQTRKDSQVAPTSQGLIEQAPSTPRMVSPMPVPEFRNRASDAVRRMERPEPAPQLSMDPTMPRPVPSLRFD